MSVSMPLSTVITVALMTLTLTLTLTPQLASATTPTTARIQEVLKEDIARFLSTSEPSWIQQLVSDPDAPLHAPNRLSREVFSGHYVMVSPTPLPDPYLVATTPAVAELVNISKELLQSDFFLSMFSGNRTEFSIFESDVIENDNGGQKTSDEGVTVLPSWATPYALSIYGQELYNNCPFGTGNGYGDGRALSVMESYSLEHGRWELQIKGSGKTPFSRSGDGRAVLRSSVREFLASEAMYHLNVSTTRALSLIMSPSEKVERPWFSKGHKGLQIDDPRIQHLALKQRKEMVKGYQAQPNELILENVAMTCRASPSYIRIGHIELYSRKYRKALSTYDKTKTIANERRIKTHLDEFIAMTKHLIFREYPELNDGDQKFDFQSQIVSVLAQSSQQISRMTADWIRVGYCQGNFNSDNSLVAGRTMDYGRCYVVSMMFLLLIFSAVFFGWCCIQGPFGFIERYEKEWNMWSGGGKPYSFRNQHIAGDRNFISLATALLPLLNSSHRATVTEEIMPNHEKISQHEIHDVFRRKLGFRYWNVNSEELFTRLDSLMEISMADYTLFYRQLTLLPEKHIIQETGEDGNSRFALLYDVDDSDILLEPFRGFVFYDELPTNVSYQLRVVLRDWLVLLLNDLNEYHETLRSSRKRKMQDPYTPSLISSRMRMVSPKYIPREWMLERAYSAAYRMDFSELLRLQTLFRNPFEEQSNFEEEYYRRIPKDIIGQGGISTMT